MTIKPDTLDALKLVKFLEREASEHKGNAGKVVLIGGAPGMAGALLLAGNASLHLGAGWTILEMFDPESAHADAEHVQPEGLHQTGGVGGRRREDGAGAERSPRP